MRNTLKPSLVQLGAWMRGEIEGAGSANESLLAHAESTNRWFTPAHSKQAMQACGDWLRPEMLDEWMGRYPEVSVSSSKKVGLVLAGNLPLVGWHDVLCVLLSGHHAVIKCSSSDTVLIPEIMHAWNEFAGDELKGRFEWSQGPMKDIDAIIATGSNNTRRHFDHYFQDVPRILRGQRTSVAVLDGDETLIDCQALGHDVFDYFGLGCRSVTKLFLPKGFDLNRLFGAWVEWSHLGTHNKYANNYDYHKALWLLNQDAILENGFLLMKEDDKWVSPVGTLFYEFYEDVSAVEERLREHRNDLQCAVRREGAAVLSIQVPVFTLGNSQCPLPWDYADEVDTMKFLFELS
jgi:hypothetical protein